MIHGWKPIELWQLLSVLAPERLTDQGASTRPGAMLDGLGFDSNAPNWASVAGATHTPRSFDPELARQFALNRTSAHLDPSGQAGALRTDAGTADHSVAASLERLGAKTFDMKPGTGLQIPKDVIYQRQGDGSVKLWNKTSGPASAILVPRDQAALWDKGIYGGTRDRTPQSDQTVVGKRVPTTLDQLANKADEGIAVVKDPTTGALQLNLQDNVAFWKDAKGNVCIQSRVGAGDPVAGNPNAPIYTLSPGEAAKVSKLNGCGFYWVLSAPNQGVDPLFNPRPQFGSHGQYAQNAAGEPVPLSGQGTA